MRTAPYNKLMPFPKSTHRRGFLKRTSIVASALSFPFVSSNNILGANQRALSVINQRLDDFDAAVESVNRFRSQLNERMVELERSAAD